MKSVPTWIRRIGQTLWQDQKGVLSFEWVLLITVLVIGVVGALSAVRDTIIDELGDLCGAAVAIDQSYTVIACQCPNTPQNPCFQVKANSFGFQDAVPECNGQPTPQRQRGTNPANQTKQSACSGGGFNP
jgi:Flp pilus assembly pilin Flp